MVVSACPTILRNQKVRGRIKENHHPWGCWMRGVPLGVQVFVFETENAASAGGLPQTLAGNAENRKQHSSGRWPMTGFTFGPSDRPRRQQPPRTRSAPTTREPSTQAERQSVGIVLNSERFVDQAPSVECQCQKPYRKPCGSTRPRAGCPKEKIRVELSLNH